METWHFIWLLAGFTGIVSSGLVGSGWAVVTGERPNIWMLSTYSVATPLRAVALMAYAPLATVKAGLAHSDQNPVLGMMFLAAGLLWSFLQGVFILTTFFGFT